MRRFFAILCTLVLVCCSLTLAVFATESTQQNAVVLEQNTEDLEIAGGSTLDLNGYSVNNLRVTGTDAVYCTDSATADFTVADGIYGKITGTVEGAILPADGYMQVSEEEGVSFHCVNLDICSMTLRPDVAGVYYTSNFAGDEVVAAQVESYGVALSVKGEPTPGKGDCGYSHFSNFNAGKDANAAASGTLLKNILKTTNEDARNTQNAKTAVYGRAYLKTADGYVFGGTVTRSLKTQVEAVNEEWATLNTQQKDAAYALYETYSGTMADWDIPNIVSWPEVKNQPVTKFVTKFTNDYVYRIGNRNAVTLGYLFEAVEDLGEKPVNSAGVTVRVAAQNSEVTGTVTANADWTKTAIQFSGTGLAKITIQDDDRCIPTELVVEVVDAVNATGATNATSNNVVLLRDCGFGSLEVSGGYTLYGNGFTMTCGSDAVALDTGYAFVTLNNGTLDNVQLVMPNFDHAVLYSDNMKEPGNRSQTDSSGKTRYYNVRNGVMVTGNSRILNSRISGARAAVNVSGGNVLIDNSRIELGAVASVLVGAANRLTLRDVTLVQKPTASTYDSSKTLMGFSVLFVCDEQGDTAPVTLEGSLVQNAWVNESYKQYVPSDGQSIIATALGQTEYLHDLNGDGTGESLNLGFAYMPESASSGVNATTVTDNRTDKAEIPYDYAEISLLGSKTYVYSYKNTNGTADICKTETQYLPNKQGDIVTVTYADAADGLETGKVFETDNWVYELNVDLDKVPGYAVDFDKLFMVVNNSKLTDIKVNGGAKPATAVVVTAGGVIYNLSATVDGKEYTAVFRVTGTETSKESPSLVKADYEDGLCVASSYGGTWHGAAPALQGIQIKYWSVAEKQYKTITLSDYTPTTAGKQNGNNTTWTYSPANGDFTLTLTGGQVHSKNNVYAVPVVCDGKLYFVAATSSGLVNTGNSARTIPVSYTFKDNNNGDVLTFSHTWSVAENKDAQYKYSDFCDGTLTQLTEDSTNPCVTPETLITLADGTQKRVDQLTGEELLLVWNLETGKYDTAPVVFIDSEQESEYEIIHLYFSDGSDVKVIYEHGFFDLDLGKYVYIDAIDYADYIGHRFVKQGDISANTWEEVVLERVALEKEVTTAWSPVTFSHLCYYTNGTLSMPGGIAGLFNIFDVDTDVMAYNAQKKAADIAAYGLFTLADFDGMITEDAFEAFNGAYLKVALAKGLLTWEDIAYMAERYIPLM